MARGQAVAGGAGPGLRRAAPTSLPGLWGTLRGSHVPAEWVPDGAQPAAGSRLSWKAEPRARSPMPGSPSACPAEGDLLPSCTAELPRPGLPGPGRESACSEGKAGPKLPCHLASPPGSAFLGFLQRSNIFPRSVSREPRRGLTRPPWDWVLPAVPSVLLVCPRLEEPAAWLPPGSHVPSSLLEPAMKPWTGWAYWGSESCKGLHQCADPTRPSPRARHHGAQRAYGCATATLFSRRRTTALHPSPPPVAQGRENTPWAQQRGPLTATVPPAQDKLQGLCCPHKGWAQGTQGPWH